MDYKDIIDNPVSSPRAEESGLLYLESRYGGMPANIGNTRDDSLRHPCSFTEEELDAEVVSAESSGYVSTETFMKELESVGDSDIVPIELKNHLSGEFLKELEENNYYLDSPIPFDALPQSEEEWMQMAAEAEESGYVTPEEFNKHCEAWSHFN